MTNMLWSDERIKQAADIEDPRRGNIVAALKAMRDDYETERSTLVNHIAELEAELAQPKDDNPLWEDYKQMSRGK